MRLAGLAAERSGRSAQAKCACKARGQSPQAPLDFFVFFSATVEAQCQEQEQMSERLQIAAGSVTNPAPRQRARQGNLAWARRPRLPWKPPATRHEFREIKWDTRTLNCRRNSMKTNDRVHKEVGHFFKPARTAFFASQDRF
jgi:hypothetical protein